MGTQAFNSPPGIAAKIFDRLGFRVDVDEVDHPDGRVVAFRVPSRPRGTAYHRAGRYLMRSGESLVPMSEDRLRRIFDEGRPELLLEPAQTGVSAEDVVELIDTQTYFELMKMTYPASRDGVVDRLVRERLVARAGS